uniref:Uncharacterized protein n=1 Tax=Manihot esculenta TaxID=3983 RepID=A0A2C9WNW8_MANES
MPIETLDNWAAPPQTSPRLEALCRLCLHTKSPVRV